MEKTFLSYIVPAYNVSKYIGECIDSLEEQNYSNYEIIIINDGSVDGTKEICEEYCKKYSNIKLINQNNRGVSYSRNLGIQEAKGEYIWFVDSDDKIERNILGGMEKCFNKNADFIIMGFYKMYKIKLKKFINDWEKISVENIEDNLILNDKIGGYICNKIYKREILRDNDLKFDEKKTYCEDLSFNITYIKYCKNILILNETYYYYRQCKKSATGRSTDKDLISMNKTYEEIFDSTNNEEIKTHVGYNYYNNIIKLKKNKDNKINIRNDIIKIGKKKKKSLKEKLKEFAIKYFYHIYILLKKIKDRIILFD